MEPSSRSGSLNVRMYLTPEDIVRKLADDGVLKNAYLIQETFLLAVTMNGTKPTSEERKPQNRS
jgi:hypothetical protein